eukprot:18581-Chlamydomonas_euryale.AAC.2
MDGWMDGWQLPTPAAPTRTAAPPPACRRAARTRAAAASPCRAAPPPAPPRSAPQPSRAARPHFGGRLARCCRCRCRHQGRAAAEARPTLQRTHATPAAYQGRAIVTAWAMWEVGQKPHPPTTHILSTPKPFKLQHLLPACTRACATLPLTASIFMPPPHTPVASPAAQPAAAPTSGWRCRPPAPHPTSTASCQLPPPTHTHVQTCSTTSSATGRSSVLARLAVPTAGATPQSSLSALSASGGRVPGASASASATPYCSNTSARQYAASRAGASQRSRRRDAVGRPGAPGRCAAASLGEHNGVVSSMGSSRRYPRATRPGGRPWGQREGCKDRGAESERGEGAGPSIRVAIIEEWSGQAARRRLPGSVEVWTPCSFSAASAGFGFNR